MVTSIYDSHVHFDVKNPKSIFEYLNDDRLLGFNLILNTDKEKQCFFQYIDEIKKIKKKVMLTVTQDYRSNHDGFVRKLNMKGYDKYALKLYPRLERYLQKDIKGILKYVSENDFSFIIVDAFYYGHELEYQISKELVIELAMALPNKKIIVAHSGGYKVLEYCMTMRTLTNVFYDLSYMNYFELSSVINDFRQLIAFNRNRVLFGTDFPDHQLDSVLNLFDSITCGLEDNSGLREAILRGNFEREFLNI